ncbi:hypothetical protein Poli38472_014764 [Pythium oligandrum]|uniref:Uncharacterized protein n=1 Tax=Pythium oligandrum TaxID=41045 RepID=A0A8K1C226_PYTOL|nr:hypothetical protein Poli38472_014764 [Pythium oligandrum]|eukprot:TMW54993.1 hypothetical protein Poli38472_014764 [Pythium oligandrum]
MTSMRTKRTPSSRTRSPVFSATVSTRKALVVLASGLLALLGTFTYQVTRSLLDSTAFTPQEHKETTPDHDDFSEPYSLRSNPSLPERCSPESVNVSEPSITRDHKHRFYTQLDQMRPRLPPPVFQGSHRALCSADNRRQREWAYCLPISGQKNEPLCTAADRMDLLVPHTRDTMCFASVLHMLMVDAYEVIKEIGGSPALVYGTLLGAIHDGATIPFTEDADIGYQLDQPGLDKLGERLFERGYHLFHEAIWRVCVAPTHPLTSRLYDPSHALPRCCNIPYVDLYHMERVQTGVFAGKWSVETAKPGHKIPEDKMLPYSKVVMNDLTFDTVADPIDFVETEYGSDYVTPSRRPSRR